MFGRMEQHRGWGRQCRINDSRVNNVEERDQQGSTVHAGEVIDMNFIGAR